MLKVLLVDDSLHIHELIVLLLEEFNFQVVSCMNAVEALNKFDEHTFDLIISDFNLPGKNGVDLCHELRKKNPLLEVIIFTANFMTTFKKLEEFEKFHIVHEKNIHHLLSTIIEIFDKLRDR